MIIDHELENAVQKSLAICEDLQIPFSDKISSIRVNNRIRAKWGYCRRIRNPQGEDSFEISISGRLLQNDVKPKKQMSVILHEILHTCPGCFNHGKEWNAYRKQIKKEKHIKIYVTASSKDMKVEPHYYIKCRKCKTKLWYIMRPTHYQNLRCITCGSKKLICFYKESGKEKERIWKN